MARKSTVSSIFSKVDDFGSGQDSKKTTYNIIESWFSMVIAGQYIKRSKSRE